MNRCVKGLEHVTNYLSILQIKCTFLEKGSRMQALRSVCLWEKRLILCGSVSSSVQLLLSCSVMSDASQTYGQQVARLSCPSLSPLFAQVHVHLCNEILFF